MTPTIKYSLLGGIVGAVIMFGAIWILEDQMNKYPALDTQVIEYLEQEGYRVDSLGGDMYRFNVEGDKYVFDYFPDDPAYLRIFAGFGAEEYTQDEVEAACIEVMCIKKNCIMIPEAREQGMAVRICCESFISDEDALDTDIIGRSIRLIQQAEILLYRKLSHQE